MTSPDRATLFEKVERANIAAYTAMLRKAPPGSKLNQIVRLMHAANVGAYRLSGGRVGGRTAGMPVLLLETIGRRSRKRRTVPVLYVREGDGFVVVGSRAGSEMAPAWYLNVREQAETLIQVGPDRHLVSVREAHGPERDELFARMVAAYDGFADYQSRTSRTIPVLVLSPRPAAS